MLGSVLSPAEAKYIDEFLDFVRDEPISFVSAVKDDLVDSVVIEHARRGEIQFHLLEADILRALANCRVDDLLRIARARKLSLQAADYLQKRKPLWGFK